MYTFKCIPIILRNKSYIISAQEYRSHTINMHDPIPNSYQV